jgi:membrane protein YqaA with SNARE-associated domain
MPSSARHPFQNKTNIYQRDKLKQSFLLSHHILQHIEYTNFSQNRKYTWLPEWHIPPLGRGRFSAASLAPARQDLYRVAMAPTLRDRILAYASQPQAEQALFGVAFLEACVLPFAAETLMIPMILVNFDKAFRYAVVATLGSVAGAAGGYLLGYFIFQVIGLSLISHYDLGEPFAALRQWYGDYAVLVVATGGFSPIPFKLFTIFSGFLQVNLPQFVMASLVARGARYVMMAWLLWRGGPLFKEWIERNLAAITMSISLALLLFFVLLKYLWQYM